MTKVNDPGRHERLVTVGEEGNKKAFIKEKTKTFFLLYQKSSEKGSKKPLHICNALF